MATTPSTKAHPNAAKPAAQTHPPRPHAADEPLPNGEPEPEPPPPEPEPGPPILEPEVALGLFYNGHRLAKHGDDPDKWISMGRRADGVAVLHMPITEAITEEIKSGEYYLVD